MCEIDHQNCSYFDAVHPCGDLSKSYVQQLFFEHVVIGGVRPCVHHCSTYSPPAAGRLSKASQVFVVSIPPPFLSLRQEVPLIFRQKRSPRKKFFSKA